MEGPHGQGGVFLSIDKTAIHRTDGRTVDVLRRTQEEVNAEATKRICRDRSFLGWLLIAEAGDRAYQGGAMLLSLQENQSGELTIVVNKIKRWERLCGHGAPWTLFSMYTLTGTSARYSPLLDVRC